MQISVATAFEKLQHAADKPFLELFRHGSMSVEIYQPQGRDLQTPHAQDEIYVVMSGQGIFQNGEEIGPFQAGDFLFVPAGIEHRFLEFSDDFKTWVIFYGPQGGEGLG